ncbi:hypothetical protein [Sphingomonas profundi]|uniref:hypothetical protein n=1 Tax=Alterirhizorhabdus profundi TaxID=2681549 RepID=UPI001E3F5846|nr:hypothetical protein [Sphingomonas profundi]
MTLHDRLALVARIAACALAGSAAGFVAWAIGALGLGSLVWAAPLVLVAALLFGLPSFGLLLAIGLVFARSIRRHTAGWCIALPVAAMAAWRIAAPDAAFPPEGLSLVALCAAASSALFFGWMRYSAGPRAGLAAA